MSESNKYPKALYSKGWEDLSAMVTVNSDEEEAEARKNGFKGLDDPVEEKKEAKK